MFEPKLFPAPTGRTDPTGQNAGVGSSHSNSCLWFTLTGMTVAVIFSVSIYY